jgi:HSP20 family protein
VHFSRKSSVACGGSGNCLCALGNVTERWSASTEYVRTLTGQTDHQPSGAREWEPFQTLRREIDRVFENFHHGFSAFGRTRMDFEPFRLLAGGWGSTPAVNMVEKDTAYELTAELPGMDDSNVELKVAGGVLTIKGEKKEVTEEKSGDYVLSERRFGSVQRSIPLPESLDLDRIEASFKNGVLTVTMPKTPEAQKSERKIAIKGG